MALDPSISAALESLRERRDALDRAIEALLALDDGDDRRLSRADREQAHPSQGAGAGDGIPSAEAVGSATVSRPPASVGGGAAGAREVLRASPGRGFTAAQLAEAMVANGWVTPSKNPRAAARAAANRLREDPDEHVFFEGGKFIYRPPGDQLDWEPPGEEDGGS